MTDTSDSFIVVKACADLTKLFGWADNIIMVHQSAMDSQDNTLENFSFTNSGWFTNVKEPSLGF